MKQKLLLLAVLFITVSSFLLLPQRKPVLYIIGDSTVRNTNRPQCGWGEMIGELLDTSIIKVSNQAMAGRSTRTFIKEKRWEKVINAIQPGDYLIMQFGHNEGSKPDTSRAGYRGVLRGTGNDSVSLNWLVSPKICPGSKSQRRHSGDLFHDPPQPVCRWQSEKSR